MQSMSATVIVHQSQLIAKDSANGHRKQFNQLLDIWNNEQSNYSSIWIGWMAEYPDQTNNYWTVQWSALIGLRFV